MKSLIVGLGYVLRERFIHSIPKTKPNCVTHQPKRVIYSTATGGMKRKATDSDTNSKAKRQREPEADYCDVIPRKDGKGNSLWPASEQSIERARSFLKEW